MIMLIYKYLFAKISIEFEPFFFLIDYIIEVDFNTNYK